MSQLKALQEELKHLLFIRAQEPVASRFWKEGVPKRLGVYRNNVQSNWTDTVNHDFSLTRRQFSDSQWSQLVERYFRKNPPAHWELNTAVSSFPTFLATQKVKAFIRELCDWELRDLQIFIDRSILRPGMGPNPTAVVRVYQHQIFDWVAAGARPDEPPLQKPEVLIFYRDVKNTCHIKEADPLMLLILEHYKKPGADLEELEPVRRQLLPQNSVPLISVVEHLQKEGLLLL